MTIQDDDQLLSILRRAVSMTAYKLMSECADGRIYQGAGRYETTERADTAADALAALATLYPGPVERAEREWDHDRSIGGMPTR
jgi:hypothetical protein